jgi:hypothetical protein
MRTFVITLIAMLAGFLIGIILSEWIGIIGVLGFGRAVGIKYLPIYTAVSSALLANLVDRSLRRKSRKD